jgi:DNA-binding transcriptional LysR family regulator
MLCEAILQDMKLNQLDGLMAFCKVAEHRGFTAAAAELEVSPSALSQAIRQLEARLGVRLLNRTTRSVSLTEAGEAYLARIRPALSQVIVAGEELDLLQGGPSGTLRINAARIAITTVVQPLLEGFLRENPNVRLELTNDEGFVDIVERGFDAGVRMGESLHKDMVATPLGGPVTAVVVASPGYLRRFPAPRRRTGTSQLRALPLCWNRRNPQMGISGQWRDRRVRGGREPDHHRLAVQHRRGPGGYRPRLRI